MLYFLLSSNEDTEDSKVPQESYPMDIPSSPLTRSHDRYSYNLPHSSTSSGHQSNSSFYDHLNYQRSTSVPTTVVIHDEQDDHPSINVISNIGLGGTSVIAPPSATLFQVPENAVLNVIQPPDGELEPILEDKNSDSNESSLHKSTSSFISSE